MKYPLSTHIKHLNLNSTRSSLLQDTHQLLRHAKLPPFRPLWPPTPVLLDYVDFQRWRATINLATATPVPDVALIRVDYRKSEKFEELFFHHSVNGPIRNLLMLCENMVGKLLIKLEENVASSTHEDPSRDLFPLALRTWLNFRVFFLLSLSLSLRFLAASSPPVKLFLLWLFLIFSSCYACQIVHGQKFLFRKVEPFPFDVWKIRLIFSIIILKLYLI